jgi:hypothetical protein
MAPPAEPDDDEPGAGATASMSDIGDAQETAGLTVSSQVIVLGAGLFSLSLWTVPRSGSHPQTGSASLQPWRRWRHFRWSCGRDLGE